MSQANQHGHQFRVSFNEFLAFLDFVGIFANLVSLLFSLASHRIQSEKEANRCDNKLSIFLFCSKVAQQLL